MKKILFTLLTLCLCGATWAHDFSVTVTNEDESDGTTFYFNILTTTDGSNQVEVTYEGSSHNSGTETYTYYGDVVIPETVKYLAEGETDSTTYAVTGIGAYAFRDNYHMTSLYIPSTIQYIRRQGCAYMGGGSAAVTGESVTEGQSEDYMMTVTIEAGTDTLVINNETQGNSMYAFKHSYIDTLYVNRNISTTEGTVPGTSNKDYVPFRDCDHLKTAVLGTGVTYLNDYYFDDCDSLKSITLPEGLDSIGLYALSKTPIEKIVIPSTVTKFSNSIFQSCSSLHTVILTAQDPSQETPTSGDFNSDKAITFYVPRGSAAEYYASAWQTNVVGQHDDFSFNFFSYDVDEKTLDAEVDGSYYATYYIDDENYEVEIPDDCSIYTITSVVTDEDTGTKQAGIVELNKASDGETSAEIIPSGTPLFIETSASGTHYFWKDYYEMGEDGNVDLTQPYFSETTPTVINVPENAILYGHSEEANTCAANGTYDEEKVEGYIFYKLSRNGNNDDYSIGFYWGADEGASHQAPAHRCWLAVSTSDEAEQTSVINISFKKDEGDTTGISSIESATEGATVKGIYTIQGVRVSNMNQPGLYIVDGKKVLVK